jgi:hypothetical protein
LQCIFIRKWRVLTEQLQQQLIQQLSQPILLLGYCNAHNTIWGSSDTYARGKIIERFVNNNNLNILNTGQPTRIASGSETAIDLSICSPQLQSGLNWNVYSTPLGSDHCPIYITIAGNRK